MIPRVLHRIFLDEPVPPKFEAFWDRARELHPEWDLVTWDSTRAVQRWIVNRDTFDRQRTHAGRSDVLRYEILARHGGVYIDTDVEVLRPFDDLLDGAPFAAWEDANMICPTVMGAEPNHPAVLALIETLPDWAWHKRLMPPNHQTGPYFLTQAWRHRADVRLLPPVSFYPVHWSRKDLLGGPYPAESWAVHHWAAGWLKNGPPQRKEVQYGNRAGSSRGGEGAA